MSVLFIDQLFISKTNLPTLLNYEEEKKTRNICVRIKTCSFDTCQAFVTNQTPGQVTDSQTHLLLLLLLILRGGSSLIPNDHINKCDFKEQQLGLLDIWNAISNNHNGGLLHRGDKMPNATLICLFIM